MSDRPAFLVLVLLIQNLLAYSALRYCYSLFSGAGGRRARSNSSAFASTPLCPSPAADVSQSVSLTLLTVCLGRVSRVCVGCSVKDSDTA